MINEIIKTPTTQQTNKVQPNSNTSNATLRSTTSNMMNHEQHQQCDEPTITLPSTTQQIMHQQCHITTT